jgi:hypothetical protein
MSQIKTIKSRQLRKICDYVPFETEDGYQITINVVTGETFASTRAIAAIVDRNESTVRTWIKNLKGEQSERFLERKETEVVTTSGIRSARLFTESQMLEIILKFKPELLLTLAQAGLRLYLHKQSGYEYRSIDENPDKSLLGSQIWKRSRANGTPTRATYQSIVSHRANVADFTNRTYQSLFNSDAKYLKENLPRVKGAKRIARNYIPSGRELDAIALLESMVVSFVTSKEVELNRIVTSDELWELHETAMDVVFNVYSNNRILV